MYAFSLHQNSSLRFFFPNFNLKHILIKLSFFSLKCSLFSCICPFFLSPQCAAPVMLLQKAAICCVSPMLLHLQSPENTRERVCWKDATTAVWRKKNRGDESRLESSLREALCRSPRRKVFLLGYLSQRLVCERVLHCAHTSFKTANLKE